MPALFIDSKLDVEERRNRLYSGDIFIFSASPNTEALIDSTRPGYFDTPVKNNSEIYNYYEWNTKSRASSGTACPNSKAAALGRTSPTHVPADCFLTDGDENPCR